ncbi:hypothetical protein HN615_07230 [Candidatus Woesearchaeota archaeon]|nr:hypothetical protein [Candidatus Woesearchaeota archaeon]
MKQLIISILILLGMGFSQEPPSIHQVEIIPYRIYPSSHPTMGCWSELELMGESQMKEEVRDKLIDWIIKIELYHEVPQYITIQNTQYYLLRLPIDSFYNYKLGMLDERRVLDE